jgi:AAA ATPase domain
MASIDELIQHEINPFDRVNLRPGNFWQTPTPSSAAVASIHQDAVNQIAGYLDLVATDHRSRSLMLIGDSGSGKSFLLDRLKRQFNDKAFFAYIGPWADSAHIWRHVLRYTVDSLMQVPIGQTESQLMQWLKGLSAFTKRSLKQRIFNDNVWGLLQNDRQKFISHLKKTYKTANIHSPDVFFGLLHDLTDPALYDLACEWLRGDDLSEESMQQLRVKHCIDSEDAAKTILANISKIATDTQPIVLCFDQTESIPESDDGVLDFQSLFRVNTLFHNDGISNFLVIITMMSDTWRIQAERTKLSDKARIETIIQLRKINLDQAEALWVEQLKSLHQGAKPLPPSPLFPLHRAILEAAFPGGKTDPRNAIDLGQKQYQKYKLDRAQHQLKAASPSPTKPIKPSIQPSPAPPIPQDSPLKQAIVAFKAAAPKDAQLQAEFKLEWEREHRKMAAKILKLTARSSPELIQMMQEVLTALDIPGVKLKLLKGKYDSYSLQYKHPQTQTKIGLVWTEDASMTSFFHIMNACQKAAGQSCEILQLVRSGGVGNAKTKANEIYRQLFEYTAHQHLKPKLSDIHSLATYHSLVNAAAARELVLSGRTIALPHLIELVRETQILQSCQLLQAIGLVTITAPSAAPSPQDATIPIREYLMNLMTTQQMMGVSALINSGTKQFPSHDRPQINQIITQLCEAKKLTIINPKDKPASQMICWHPD